MDQIITHGLEMAPYMLGALPALLIFRWLRARGLQKRGLYTSWRHELALCVFLMFLVGLASQTVLPPFQMGEDGPAIVWGRSLRLNLVPFRIFADSIASGMDYFIINEFTTNYDAGWLSTYIYRDIGGKYEMVIWDFNSACDNYEKTTVSPQHFEMQDTVWHYMLMKDEYFVQRIIERYRELRKSFLSEAYLNEYIDDTVAFLGPAIDRNFQVWGSTFEEFLPLSPRDRNPTDHAAAVQQVMDFIQERGSWMDEHIEILLQYCHESKNKKFNH